MRISTAREIRVGVDGEDVGGVLHEGAGEAFLAHRGRPCVVLGHGFASTRDSGLDAFAARLAEAGVSAVAFDYRGFGDSSGRPRQDVDPARQLADYRAVLRHVAALEGIDADRLVAWGVSLAGGHVLALASGDSPVAAAIALTPMTSGPATVLHRLRHEPMRPLLSTSVMSAIDAVSGRFDRERHLVPVAGDPPAVFTDDAFVRGMARLAGPAWKNEVTAASVLAVAAYRPVPRSAVAGVPVLVQIADDDSVVPPRAAQAAAVRARALVRHYPGDHFDVHAGGPVHDLVVDHQLLFLRQTVGGRPDG